MLDAAGVDPGAGLSSSDARRRLAQVGPNALPEPPHEKLATQAARQLRDPTAVLLLAAAVSGVVLGEVTEAIAIAVIVVINGTIAVVEERRAASALEALRTLTVPTARVQRDGSVQQTRRPTSYPGMSSCSRPVTASPPTSGSSRPSRSRSTSPC